MSSPSPLSAPSPLHVGLVGAGIGGLTASIGLARNGARVTILEAATTLGEIGAGIQMTPNVARLLIDWGVAAEVGDNLVEFEALRLRRRDGEVVGQARMRTRELLGVPWWVVHRMHLHEGLVRVARRVGVEIVTGARVTELDYTRPGPVRVRTEGGARYSFDLLVGSDGVNSVVRRTLFPHVRPEPPTGNCAYRAVIPWEQVLADPVAGELAARPTMEVWMGARRGKEHGYIISYPIGVGEKGSGKWGFNMVLSHFRPEKVYEVQDATLDEVRETYRDYDPRIRRVIDMIPSGIRRWPLMVTRCPSWSSPQKNVVLMGDAAHSMVNHMAQGAATSMEDGAFLAEMIGAVMKGKMDVATAVELYEKERMPLADLKQQLSYINGAIWHLEEDSPEQLARDEAMRPELNGQQLIRTPNLYADPHTMLSCYGYDPVQHAQQTINTQLRGEPSRDKQTHVTEEQADVYMNWFTSKSSGIPMSKL